MIHGIIAGGLLDRGAEASANFLIYPLTYDEEDKDGGNALTRLGPGPAITPAGFEADGFTSRLRNTSLPPWLASATAKVSLSVHVRGWASSKNVTRDVIVSLGNNDATGNPKAEIALFTDEASGDATIGFRTTAGSVITRFFGKTNWRYGVAWPAAFRTSGVHTVRPQGLLFLDTDTLLISGHYADTESRVYKIDLSDGTVIGTFTFGTSTYRHVAAWAMRGNGEVWCVDYETGFALEIDIDASFASGTAVIKTAWNLSAMGNPTLTGIEFITVSGIEYVLIAQYKPNATGTVYLYVIPTTEIANGATFNLANRFKRFVLSRQCQGMALRPADNLLYMAHNADSALNNSPVYVIDIVTQILSTPDGGNLVEVRRHQGPSEYPEDIKFHPATGEAWIGTEGRSAVIDNLSYLAYWRSPLTDNLPVERHIRVEYNGAGLWTFYSDGRLFGTLAATPSVTPAALSIGAPPQASAGWTNGFSLATIRSLALKDGPFNNAELAALSAGTYEANALTVHNVTLSNPGAESGIAGWTTESGGLGVRSSGPLPRYQEGFANSQYFTGGTSAATLVRQRLSIASVTGLSTAEIDAKIAAGNLWAGVTWWQSNFDGTADPGGMGLRYLDGTPAAISTTYSGIVDLDVGARWRRRTHSVAAPATSRNLDVLQRMDRTSGTNNDSYIDDIAVQIYSR